MGTVPIPHSGYFKGRCMPNDSCQVIRMFIQRKQNQSGLRWKLSQKLHAVETSVDKRRLPNDKQLPQKILNGIKATLFKILFYTIVVKTTDNTVSKSREIHRYHNVLLSSHTGAQDDNTMPRVRMGDVNITKSMRSSEVKDILIPVTFGTWPYSKHTTPRPAV